MSTEPPETPEEDTPPAAAADEWVPPSREEHEKMQRALAKANAEAKTHRETARALQAKSEDADSKAAREATEAAERRLKPVAVRSAAKAAFLEAGLQGASADRVAKLVRMLDLDALDIDDDGDVTGLAEQVATVKREIPELFVPTEKRPPRLTTGDKPPSNGRALTTGEKIAAQVLGR